MKANDVTTAEVVTLPPGLAIQDAANVTRVNGTGGLSVTESDGKVIGTSAHYRHLSARDRRAPAINATCEQPHGDAQ